MRTSLRLLAMSALILPAALAGTSAQAATDTTPGTAAAAGVTSIEREAGSVSHAAAYWTAARRAAATPADEVEKSAGPVTASSAPEPVRRFAQAVAPKDGGDLTVQLNESITVGKIFYTSSTDGLGHYCSASVVNSAARNMVFTAAHCVHDGPGKTWHTANWMFVPSYRNGDQPYGTWDWSTLAVPSGWISSRERRYDVAVALVYGSRSVVDAVGANGLLTGGGRAYHYDIFGYPSNKDSGEVQWICSGTSRDAGSDQIEIDCGFGGGASGGPWYYSYDNTGRRGDVHGVMSYSSGTNTNGSPYFSAAVVGTLYNTYANDTW
jgi:V8-like Glu-specific endopeptidase